MLEAITLLVGQTYHLRRGKDRITYAGMVSENVYSIIQQKAQGNHGYAWNLFFPRRKQNLIIDDVSITIDNVSSEEIRLRV